MHTLPGFLKTSSSSALGRNTIADASEPYQLLLAMWLIELALMLRWYRKTDRISYPDIFSDGDFLALTGIEPCGERDEDGDIILYAKKVNDASSVRLLKHRLAELRKLPLEPGLALFRNIEILAGLVGLNDAEKALLAFVAALNVFRRFNSAISSRSESVTTVRLGKIAAVLTGWPEGAMRDALKVDGLLSATGILSVNKHHSDLENKVDLLDGLGELLFSPQVSEDNFVDHFLKRTGTTPLTPEAFPHLGKDVAALRDYLAGALKARAEGVNVLFYGPPGVGKTELVKALATALGFDLYEIHYADGDGDPIKGQKRLRAYNLCQRLLARRQNALLMFDEIEDVFESRMGLWMLFGGGETVRSDGKAWINRTLERNPVPAIWLTNDADIDPAYLHRFDYSVRFAIPPQPVRLEIARSHLGEFDPPAGWLETIAASEHTTPRQLERAAKVARIASAGDPAHGRELVVQALARSASLLGQKRAPVRNLRHTGYDLKYLNTDSDIPRLVAALGKRPSATLAFYGPAGTGKSELARHVADSVGKPLVVKRASDILSMWVGGSERNIAAMFDEARQQDAVLLLDEADSFLADRRGAVRSWEVTQVNELLTQMEAFEGIFVATTNLMEKLDQASLRRFAFKVKFDYLTAEQRWELFEQEFARLGSDMTHAAEWQREVRRLERLTPGDFAAAVRQFTVWGSTPAAGELVEALRKEVEAKGGAAARIGFTA